MTDGFRGVLRGSVMVNADRLGDLIRNVGLGCLFLLF